MSTIGERRTLLLDREVETTVDPWNNLGRHLISSTDASLQILLDEGSTTCLHRLEVETDYHFRVGTVIPPDSNPDRNARSLELRVIMGTDSEATMLLRAPEGDRYIHFSLVDSRDAQRGRTCKLREFRLGNNQSASGRISRDRWMNLEVEDEEGVTSYGVDGETRILRKIS